ncbi:MAG: alpha-L-rhamnosidase N-terminal domain-containing protein, partial [Clostridia bacterium]|nr:alpha-L-rhamnosidase N-terminal domain-containing protein [Clostridia bacterium]
MLTNAKWIRSSFDPRVTSPVFVRSFTVDRAVRSATLSVTARGVYEAELNGRRVGDFILAPGWTAYKSRLQVQEYDVTAALAEKNT